MAKNEARTLSVILEELNQKVNAYNKLEAADPKRADLTSDTKKLVDEYNQLSLLLVYGKCVEAKLPLKMFAETFEYGVVSTSDKLTDIPMPDGSKKSAFFRSVKDGTRMLELEKFIHWAEEHNYKVTQSKDWLVKMLTAKQTIRDAHKRFNASSAKAPSISVRKLKSVLQDMFDALLFIPTEKGENAVIATGEIARFVYDFANKLNTSVGKDQNGKDKGETDGWILPDSIWKVLQMRMLRRAVQGKNPTIKDGDDEGADENQTTPDTDEPATEAPAAEETVTD